MSTNDAERSEHIRSGCGTVAAILFILFWIVIASSDDFFRNVEESSPDFEWVRYDVIVHVNDDGSLHVTEQQEIRFGGRYSEGFAEIPLSHVEGIDDVSVRAESRVEMSSYGDAEPQGHMVRMRQVDDIDLEVEDNVYSVREENGILYIDYAFEPTSRGSSYTPTNMTRTIVLEYDVRGAIRTYPDAAEPWEQLHWIAISADTTEIAPISNASVTFFLPDEPDPEGLVMAPAASSVEGDSITWRADTLESGEELAPQAAFPIMTTATEPSWQTDADAFDDAAVQQDQRTNAARFMLLLAGILVAVAGGITVLYGWFTGVRERPIGVVPETLTDKPDDMPAGLVGSLIDETVHPRDVAAEIISLAQRGVISIHDGGDTNARNWQIALREPLESVAPWERVLLRTLYGVDAPEVGRNVPLSQASRIFVDGGETLQRAIDDELVNRRYYAELPDVSRRRWSRVILAFPVLGLVAAVGLVWWHGAFTPWAAIPIAAGLIIWFFAKRLTPSMARKTPEGADAAARWHAFGEHLKMTWTGTDALAADAANDPLMPWLLALGIDSRWLHVLATPESVPRNTQTSRGASWSGWPISTSGSQGKRERTWRQSTSGNDRTSGPSGSLNIPSLPNVSQRLSGPFRSFETWGGLQGASDASGGLLQRASGGGLDMIGDVLAAVGEASQSASSGGGGSSSSRRSGGGRSSSRSGGGRSRSGSGGGRRGFR